jgi:hypothetical protein
MLIPFYVFFKNWLNSFQQIGNICLHGMFLCMVTIYIFLEILDMVYQYQFKFITGLIHRSNTTVVNISIM